MKTNNQRMHGKLHRDVILSLVIILFVLLLSTIGIIGPFDSFELRIYDLLMSGKKAAPERDDVVIVAIDDNSIGDLGTFPWSRDIVADGLIRMRELGADSMTFDIEYISKSKKGVDPDVDKKLNRLFSSAGSNIQEYFSEIQGMIASGYYSAEEMLEIVSEISSYVDEVEFSELYETVKNDMTMDMDEYFADSLAFFGNSWLTLNVGDLGIDISD